LEILLRHPVTATADSFWSTLPLGRDVQIVARDANGVVAFAKPAGVLSHPNESRDEPRSLLTAHYDRTGEVYSWPASAERAAGKLWLLNRLDSATSGLLLAAATEKLAHEIRASFQKRHVKKVYNALVFGAPRTAREVWTDRLAVEKRGGQIRTATTGHIPSEAHVRVLRSKRDARILTLIELEPKTGRSHQLRVQCTKRHLPIVGDATYGDFRANRDFAKATGEKRLFLHSLHTEFSYTWSGRDCHFSATAPLPGEFGAVL
jgi:23S rRNA-/tRNA-specific pseudouridylate synthase